MSITEDTANLRGRKINKSRVTILTGVKADGTRLPLWCIGTAACPRWPKPKNSKMEAKPPLQYLSSKKGWMTTTLFAKILADLEKKFSKSKSKILLILDNCPAHCGFEEEYDGEKTFIKVLMLPKNTTSNLQPCDAGVIRSMKAHYRARLTRFLVYKEAKDVSLYEGLLMLRAAWEEVSSDVVRNAWRKTGLKGSMPESEETILEEVNKDVEMLAEKEDEEPICVKATTDVDELAQSFLEGCEELHDDDSNSEEKSALPTVPSTSVAHQYVQALKSTLISAYGDVPACLLEVERMIHAIPKKQVPLEHFWEDITVKKRNSDIGRIFPNEWYL